MSARDGQLVAGGNNKLVGYNINGSENRIIDDVGDNNDRDYS